MSEGDEILICRVGDTCYAELLDQNPRVGGIGDTLTEALSNLEDQTHLNLFDPDPIYRDDLDPVISAGE